MRIVINGLCTLKRKSGIGYYTECLQQHLAGIDNSLELHVWPTGLTRRAIRFGYRRFIDRARPATVSSPSRFRARFASLPPMDTIRGNALSMAGHDFRRFCRSRNIELYHEPNFIPFSGPVPTISTIHDLSVLLHPEWHPSDRVRAHQHRFFRGLENCRHFITVSEFTRREMIDRLGIRPDRITAVINGVRENLMPLPNRIVRERLHKLGLPSRYLLHVGTIEPRKNLLMLLKAYCGLPEPVRTECPLVLAGGWGWNSADLLDYFHTTARHCNVIRPGYIEEDDLAVLYNGAVALVFPTHYEGLGLPPIEMMACGGAVLASTAAAVTEVMGSHGIRLDPNDLEGWRDAMFRVMEDPDHRESLRQGVTEHAAGFTWVECARRTFEVYRNVLES